MTYKHLNFEKRCIISAFWKAGYTQKKIAQEIGVSTSTISREIKRNSRWNGVYTPEQADASYKLKRKNSKKNTKFTNNVAMMVTEKLLLKWSPEQISGYGKLHNLFEISHERIYQYVLADKKSGGTLYKSLRYGKKRYRRRYGSERRNSPVKDRIFIDERPKIVEAKQRLGDWEIDTIVGKGHKNAIVTLVERVSKKTLIGRVTSKKSTEIAQEIIALLLPLKQHVFTITSDNGGEFALHKLIAKELEAQFYFAHPYHSWERGLNENTNGLIRQYIPKRTNFSELTCDDLKIIIDELNTRPRKLLGYATPNDVFYNMQQKETYIL